MKKMCRGHGDRPDCLGEADERFTMNFDDIGESPLHWCARCGADARAMEAALLKTAREKGAPFVKRFSELIDEAEAKMRVEGN